MNQHPFPYGILVQIKKGPFAGHRGYVADYGITIGVFRNTRSYRLVPENKAVRNQMGFDRFSEMYFAESNLRVLETWNERTAYLERKLAMIGL